MKRILLTGAMRSGTTLLQKLLSSHPGLCIYSQPLPLLYVDVKRRYLQRYHRADTRYPLSDQFLGTHFPVSEFLDFLRDHRIPIAGLRKLLADQENYSGQRTDLSNYLPAPDTRSMDLAQTVDSVLDWLGSTEKRALEGVGSKEVFCEEFIPYFLNKGYRVLLIIRDPRDVLASAIAGEEGPDVGRPRPVLFLLRQWRKSVAYAIEHQDHRNFHYCRFEDLLSSPNPVLEAIYDFLRLPRPPRLDDSLPIVDQKGRPWISNSSHRPQTPTSNHGLNLRSMGAFRKVLAPNQVRFIEALGFSEMQWLSYHPTIGRHEVENILNSEPEDASPPDRQELADYRWCATRRAEEVDRWCGLMAGECLEAAFPFRSAFETLSLRARKRIR